jgi:hypothetical protein
MTGVLRVGVDPDAPTVGVTVIADVRRAVPPLHAVAASADTWIECWCTRSAMGRST